ncbi:MAG: disulfide bond formation protein B [Alphaproteobacteria bacterium]|nr:disulfide bond formation protein B [Alphaproteobacteria bacterium]
MPSGSPALAALLALSAVALAAVCGALFFQFVVGIAPCPLCYMQRWAYYFVIPCGLLGMLLRRAAGAPDRLIRGLLLVILLAVLANAGLGIYHSGVEWGFWPGPAECSGPMPQLGSVKDMLANLDRVKVVRCDEVQWRDPVLGLSLAGYNVLLSLTMAIVAVWGLLAPAPPPKPL